MASHERLTELIREVGNPIALALGVEILEVQCVGKAPRPLVRLTLDKDGGVKIEDCEAFHQSLRRAWEVTQPTELACRFEISSPGLDRPLKNQRDFLRVKGERLRVIVNDSTTNNTVIIGRLVDVTDTGIQLIVGAHQAVTERHLDWREILKAKVEVDF